MFQVSSFSSQLETWNLKLDNQNPNIPYSMTAIYLIGFIQSLFVSSIFLIKKRKQPSDYVLSIYVLTMGLFLFFMYAKLSDFYNQNPITIVLDILYWLLIGPALYIYIDLITSRKQKFKLSYLLHAIPTIIVFIGFGGFFFQDEVIYFEIYQSDSLIYTIANYIWYYNSVLYYIFCIYKLYRHKKKVKHFFSNTEKRDLKWLFFLANGFAAYLVIGLILGILSYYFDIGLPFGSRHYTWIVMVAYIFGIGYYGYAQKNIFSDKALVNEQNNENPLRIQTKYTKSRLGKDERLIIAQRLNEIMKKEQPYLDSELTLSHLSEKLETTNHKLSQVFNEVLKTTFYDYVNSYRIDYAKKALENPSQLNEKILAIAFDSGFNSKSVFYTTFKKQTKQTPSEYRKNAHTRIAV